MRYIKKISGVYSIENLINNKKYIGSSFDIYNRWIDHKSMLKNNKHHSKYLQNAWNKYGKENFKFNVLEICDVVDLLTTEQKWYDFYNSGDSKYGYNMCSIARSHGKIPSLELLNDNEYTISLSQFNEIVELLTDTNYSLMKISDYTKASYSSVCRIYNKENFSNLTNDVVFHKRKSGKCKLDEKEVMVIIDRLLKNEFPEDIAKDFDVTKGNISSIRNHKSWTYLTKDIVFDNIKKRSHKDLFINMFDIDNKYITTYKSIKDAGTENNIHRGSISDVCSGKRKTAGGYIWKYA